MKIKILKVTDYVSLSRRIKVGQIYKVSSCGINKDNERFFIFTSKNNKVSLAYSNEVIVIKDDEKENLQKM